MKTNNLLKSIRVCFVILITFVSAYGNTYYIDAVGGNDGSSGTSEANAWQTLSHVSSFTFQPGDQILFKSGSVWNERVAFNGSGSVSNPIIVDQYGTGNKPIFNGGGGASNEPTVLLENEQYWEINNLEITNSDGSLGYQSDLWGIRVNATVAGEFNHIHIRNCYIHNVNGDQETKTTGGIYVTIESSSNNPAWYNDLKIQNNTIGGQPGGDLVAGLGIATQSTHGSLSLGAARKPFLNVLVSDNIVGPTGRNSVILRVSDDAVVERNRLVDPGRFSHGHAFFNFNTERITVQYNEAYGNTGPYSDIDRGAYDADYNSRDTYYQYNYSHDNNWGFAVMKKGIQENVVFRYNISENDQQGIYYFGFNSSTDLTDAHFYNNTHYVASNIVLDVFKDRTALNSEFFNNVFYFEGTGDWGTSLQGPPINCTFENNCYYNITPKGTNYITSNPQLVAPGTGGQDIDWSNYPNVLTGYQLQATSPCIDAGRAVADNGSQDFWGNSLYIGSPDIGAHEFSTLQNVPSAPSGLNSSPASSSQIDLGWTDNANNENGYKIERKTTGSFTEIATVGANVYTYSDSGLNPSTTYTYRVRAYNNGGDSGYSNEDASTTLVAPLLYTLNPTNDAYVRGGSSVDINFGNVSDLVIKKGTDSSFFRKSYVMFDLSGIGNVQNAIVRLYASSVSSAYTVSVYESADGWEEGTITWNNAPVENNVIVSTSVTSAGQYYEWDVTAYVDDQASIDGVVSFVFYDGAANNSQIIFNSKEASSNIPELHIEASEEEAGVPNAPSALTATTVSDSQIDLSWTDNANDETGYKIERKTTGNYVEIATVAMNVTSYTSTGLSPITTYTYRVRATNGVGDSGYSNEDSATTDIISRSLKTHFQTKG